MNSILELSIPGNPQALKRHRHFKRGNFVQTYDPSEGDKMDFLALAMSARPEKPLDEPLKVVLIFNFSRPKNHYRTGKYSNELKESAPHWHTKVPDVDNLIKFVCDALNGIFWKDDSCICKLETEKKYAETASTQMNVYRTL